MGSLYLCERYKLAYIIHKQSPKRDLPVPAFIYCTAFVLLKINVIKIKKNLILLIFEIPLLNLYTKHLNLMKLF